MSPLVCRTRANLRGESAGVNREDDRERGLAAVPPTRGAGLRVQVDDGGVPSRAGGRHGQVQGDGRLSGAPFLTNDGNGVHQLKKELPARLHACKSEGIPFLHGGYVQVCKIACVHDCALVTAWSRRLALGAGGVPEVVLGLEVHPDLGVGFQELR